MMDKMSHGKSVFLSFNMNSNENRKIESISFKYMFTHK